jgi:uncharacterized protein (TIGR00369 family)
LVDHPFIHFFTLPWIFQIIVIDFILIVNLFSGDSVPRACLENRPGLALPLLFNHMFLVYKKGMNDFNDNQNCFVCGQRNPMGLKIEFRENSDREIEAEVVFPDHLQGWQDTVHGGLLATVLDETMIKAAAAAGIKCVTAEITVKYKIPAVTGTAYRASGKVLEARGRLVTAESRLCDSTGQVHAQATGKLFKI